MAWVRMDDQFADHPKVVGLSDAAFRLHITGICYAARQETDGVIPRAAAFVNRKRAMELVGAGVWHEHTAGYLIHDFLDYNPSAASLREKRAADSARKARGSRGGFQPDSNRPVPSRPDPVPPEPEIPPVSPQRGELARAQRARAGSKRKRDVIALRAGQTAEEQYLGKYSRRTGS